MFIITLALVAGIFALIGVCWNAEAREEREERAAAAEADRYALIVARNEADRERGSGVAWWVSPAADRAQREASYARSVAGWWKD